MKASFREVQGEAALSSAATHLDSVGIALGMTGAVLFSMKAVLVKMAYGVVPDLPAVTLMVLRMGLSFPIYVAILLIARRAGEGETPLCPPCLFRFGCQSLSLTACGGEEASRRRLRKRTGEGLALARGVEKALGVCRFPCCMSPARP